MLEEIRENKGVVLFLVVLGALYVIGMGVLFGEGGKCDKPASEAPAVCWLIIAQQVR